MDKIEKRINKVAEPVYYDIDILIQLSFEHIKKEKMKEIKIQKARNRKAVTWDSIFATNTEQARKDRKILLEKGQLSGLNKGFEDLAKVARQKRMRMLFGKRATANILLSKTSLSVHDHDHDSESEDEIISQ